jgi:transcriptional regulator with XRE-family HTH domain
VPVLVVVVNRVRYDSLMETNGGVTPTKVVAGRVRELRERRRLTGTKLAEGMTKAGLKWDRATVAKLETGRRQSLTLEEVLALAAVLNVAPVHLLIPVDSDQEPYPVTSATSVPSGVVREWIRGKSPLPGSDRRDYFSEVPEEEFQRGMSSPEDLKAWLDSIGGSWRYFPPEDQDRPGG